MTSTMIRCPECGSPVPSGRLACSECGALIAAVGGSTKSRRGRSARPTPKESNPALPETTPAPGSDSEAAVDFGAEDESGETLDRPVAPPSEGAISVATGADQATPPVTGAYLPPSATYRSALLGANRPLATDPAQVAFESGGPAVQTESGVGAADAIPAEAATWLVISGCLVATFSFLLPWATNGVIGASGIGYLAMWGLANPGHLMLALGLIGLLGVQLIPDRLPAWIRVGVLPLVAGGILMGLAFAYFARPFGGGTGVTFLLAAAAALLAGGLLGIRSARG